METADLIVTATTAHFDGIVAVGFFATEDDHSPFVVVRFLADGGLDRGFGRAGVVTAAVGTCDDQAVDVGVQRDGKIVVVGTSFDFGGGSKIAVLRFLPDGTLDPTFGDGGWVALRLGRGYDQAESLELADDDTLRILVEPGAAPGRRTLVLGGRGESLFPASPVLHWVPWTKIPPTTALGRPPT